MALKVTDMRRFVIMGAVLGLATFALLPPARADEPAALNALRAGNHVALMRHTEAPGGAGDPPGFRLDGCTTQRNLSADCRAGAPGCVGALRSANASVGKIPSSPRCRCIATAKP